MPGGGISFVWLFLSSDTLPAYPLLMAGGWLWMIVFITIAIGTGQDALAEMSLLFSYIL
jgi:hypothetical protein